MNITPLGDRVILKVVTTDEEKVGSIIVPDTAREKPQEAEILAVGPGRATEDGERLEMEISVGDRVLFGKWSGTEVTVDGETILIMRETEILARL